jgi:hypothetical protein
MPKCWQDQGDQSTFYEPVAQLDRALVCGAKGRAFDSRRAHHIKGLFAMFKRRVYGII